jgi:hypothetical protein
VGKARPAPHQARSNRVHIGAVGRIAGWLLPSRPTATNAAGVTSLGDKDVHIIIETYQDISYGGRF